ncbi:hypothetical protein F5Y03DRAFT_401794 [Xylaria venustula]|nr:hypothetical protein F5Y03DRAFT_401794 [Xylaria venustula]
MKLWYLLAIVRFRESFLEPPPGVELLFRDVPTIVFSGYALWDELQVPNQPVPDINELREDWTEIFEELAYVTLTISPTVNVVPNTHVVRRFLNDIKLSSIIA